MAWVYVLQGTQNNRFYIGSTVNLDQRIQHHLGGFTPSTKRFGGVRLVFSQEYKTLQEARTIELKLKKLKRKDYIQKIIQEGRIKMRP
ncbi:MAG: putative endonuclease containing a URI domain [Parcubacteria group bacterium Gr01-1014_70]|nr:MAG: putative endonuclease containing a URI domain [Parcubacteria group bacterium Gr01-1014_70]